MTKRKLGNIGICFGITSMLMLFVIPFIIVAIDEPLMNNTTFCWIYFSIFFSSMFISGKVIEKSECKTIQDEREDKLKELL